jgi:hypothetical protein
MQIPESYSALVAGRMDAFFEPLVSIKATGQQRDEFQEKEDEVCKKAVSLKFMMQRSKEGFSVTNLNIKERPLYSKVSHWAVLMAVEAGKSTDASDEIAYVLFGALEKQSINREEDGKVLEKAQVILKRKPQG